MKIQAEHRDHQTLMTLRGELTEDTTDEFRREVLEHLDARTHDCVLDMSHVGFVDSKGLETLLWLQDRCVENLGQVRLACCPETIRTILKITRLDESLTVCPTIDEAVRSLNV